MKRILVIEDQETTMVTLQAKFEAEGYVVDTAENGKLGLAKMAEFDPDLVVTDIEMPELDGLGFLNTIADPATRAYPCKVIVISADVRGLLAQAKLFGVNATFEKPLDLELLIAKVRELVGQDTLYH